MAKKPAPSYANVELAPQEPSAPLPAREQATTRPQERRGRGRTLREQSAPVMLYLHPAASKALKRYALEENTKVHSLLIEAVEAWFRSHGLREPVKAQADE